MRIKFEDDGQGDYAQCLTLCPHKQTIDDIIVRVGSVVCRQCNQYRGTEGDEVICGREEE